MASIQMNMGTETEINATPNKDGLILFDTTNKKIILDNNGTREALTKHIEANPNLNGAEQLENLKVNGEVLNFLPVDISNVEKDGEEISDILEDKYDTEGDYNTTVDKCTDLTRVAPVTDTAPYIYRQTPVKESFKALMKKIVGASVVWNQMVNSYIATQEINGLTITNNGDSISIEGTVETAFNFDYFVITPQTSYFIRGTNKYLIKPSFKIPHKLGIGGFASCVDENSVGGITELYGTGIWQNGIYIEAKLGDTFNIQNLRLSVIDLTAMFGTTIADYVYTLETAETGTGIAWLQSYGFFTEDYYAYKQNKLESGCVSAHKTYDGETLLTNTELSPITLRGLFKLSTDKLTVDGDEYNADGSVTRKYGIVDLGSLEWSYNSNWGGYPAFYSNSLTSLVKKPSADTVIANAICEVFEMVSLNTLYGRNGNGFGIGASGGIVLRCYEYTDTQTFINAMSGKYLLYELATPTTEQTTPFTETEIVGSTEEFIDYEVAQGNRDVAIPVGTETDYYQSYNIPPIPFTDCYLSASNQKLDWVSNS